MYGRTDRVNVINTQLVLTAEELIELVRELNRHLGSTAINIVFNVDTYIKQEHNIEDQDTYANESTVIPISTHNEDWSMPTDILGDGEEDWLDEDDEQ